MVVEMVVEAVAEAAEVVVRSLRMLDIERLVLVDLLIPTSHSLYVTGPCECQIY